MQVVEPQFEVLHVPEAISPSSRCFDSVVGSLYYGARDAMGKESGWAGLGRVNETKARGMMENPVYLTA